MLILLFLLNFASAQPSWQGPLETEIKNRVANNQFKDGSFGVISKTTDVVVFGNAKPDTIFEIGSITKAFTGIIFAQMVLEKRLSPEHSVAMYIPELKGTFAGQIKLSDLVSHTSGLARIPSDLPFNENPYAKYKSYDLIQYLKSVFAPPEIKPDYSNTGFALLGYILTLVEKEKFDLLISKRITEPLKMIDTVAVVPAENQNRFIDGYDFNLSPASHWDFDVFAPTGALRSTVQDMLSFAAANLNPNSTLLGQAITLSQSKNWGWDSGLLNMTFPYKNGGTGGFRSALLVDRKRNIAIVILTNTSYEADSLVVPILKNIRQN